MEYEDVIFKIIIRRKCNEFFTATSLYLQHQVFYHVCWLCPSCRVNGMLGSLFKNYSIIICDRTKEKGPCHAKIETEVEATTSS